MIIKYNSIPEEFKDALFENNNHKAKRSAESESEILQQKYLDELKRCKKDGDNSSCKIVLSELRHKLKSVKHELGTLSEALGHHLDSDEIECTSYDEKTKKCKSYNFKPDDILINDSNSDEITSIKPTSEGLTTNRNGNDENQYKISSTKKYEPDPITTTPDFSENLILEDKKETSRDTNMVTFPDLVTKHYLDQILESENRLKEIIGRNKAVESYNESSIEALTINTMPTDADFSVLTEITTLADNIEYTTSTDKYEVTTDVDLKYTTESVAYTTTSDISNIQTNAGYTTVPNETVTDDSDESSEENNKNSKLRQSMNELTTESQILPVSTKHINKLDYQNTASAKVVSTTTIEPIIIVNSLEEKTRTSNIDSESLTKTNDDELKLQANENTVGLTKHAENENQNIENDTSDSSEESTENEKTTTKIIEIATSTQLTEDTNQATEISTPVWTEREKESTHQIEKKTLPPESFFTTSEYPPTTNTNEFESSTKSVDEPIVGIVNRPSCENDPFTSLKNGDKGLLISQCAKSAQSHAERTEEEEDPKSRSASNMQGKSNLGNIPESGQSSKSSAQLMFTPGLNFMPYPVCFYGPPNPPSDSFRQQNNPSGKS